MRSQARDSDDVPPASPAHSPTPPSPPSAPYGPDHQGPGPERPRDLGVASFVSGLVAVLTSFVPVTNGTATGFEVEFLVGFLLGVLAVVFAVLTLRAGRRRGTRRGLAVAGLCLGIIAVVLKFLEILVLAVILRSWS